MKADLLLNRLDGVRDRGHGRWLAKCPAHDDRSPSLSVREADDGVVLLKCFSGCCVADIVAAVGLELRDLFPESNRGDTHARKPSRNRVPPLERLEIIDHETAVVCVIAGDLASGEPLTDDLVERLHTAAARIGRARYEHV